MAGGRPRKLTPELQDHICALVRIGKPIEVVCGAAGIDDSLLSKWRKELRNPDTDVEIAAQLEEFFRALARASFEGQLHLLDRVDQGDEKGVSNGPAKGAQWLLERLWPSKYAPRLNVKLEEGLDLLLADVEVVCGSKDCGCYEAILAQLAAREAGAAETPSDTDSEARVH